MQKGTTIVTGNKLWL